jgi:hypothetical protein
MGPNLNATSAGGYTDVNAGAVQGAVGKIGPFASTYQVPTFNSPQALKNGGVSGSPSIADQFFSKVGSIFKESGHMFEGAANWVGRQVVDMGKSAINEVPSLAHFSMDTFHTLEYSSQQDQLTSRLEDINKQYKSGQLNRTQYSAELTQWQKDSYALQDKLTGLSSKVGYDGGQVIHNTINTAADIITVMTAGLSSPLTMTADTGTQDAASFLSSRAADNLFSGAENAVYKMSLDAKAFNALPSYVQNGVKASLTDTFMNIGAQATSKEAARAAVTNLALKYPLAFNYLSGTGQDLYKKFQSGKYGDAIKSLGFNIALLFSGGPIGEAMKYGGKALTGVSHAIFGSTSFLDTLSKSIGDGNPASLFNAIKDNPDTIKAFQALEATNMAATDNKAVSAAYRVLNGLKANGWDLSTSTHKDFVDNVMGWHQAQTILHDGLRATGMSEADTRKFVVGRWTANDANQVAAALTKNDMQGFPQTAEDRLQAWNDYKLANPNSAVANNKNLDRQITNIIQNTHDPVELDSKIRGIKAQFAANVKGLKPEVWKQIGKLGYVPIVPSNLEAPFVEGTQKLVTNVGESNGFFQKAVQPMPILKDVGAFLVGAGLSPERSQQSTYDLFHANLTENLAGSSAVEKNMISATHEQQANDIMHKLTDYVNGVNSTTNIKHPPISDLRQLTVKEISEATGKSAKDALTIAQSINQSMLDIKLAERGIGNKLLDYVQSIRPGSKLSMNGYLRAQGAGRFAWNPFFKMKLAYKTEALSQLESGGKWPTLLGTNKILATVFQGRYGNLEDTAKMLESKGMFTAGFSNEAADEAIAALRGARPSQLLQSQKLSIAGLLSSQAERAGMNVETFVNNYPNEVRDTVEAILHYNPKSSFLNSPLARTLNFAFFPFRFNLKVSTFMAKSLARQDALTQVAVIHGMMQAHTFLNSQQGQVWYSQNSDAIGLLGYFSPLETLSTIANLGNIGHESIGSLGELGGLPVGFIPQILQAEGMWNPSTPYLNPKTGVPSPNYIPLTMKSKIATALTSFLGSLFTYPGSTAGLPSKTGTLSKAAQGLTGAKSTDWNKVTPTNLTPQQQQYEQAVSQLQPNQVFKPPAQTQNPDVAVSSTQSATASPYYKKTGSSTPPAKKLKKTQEPVSLLPGQTAIGQP